eukprot:TRINITY_DN61967_c0_g3_i2.p1 TRINITY_DN61967_c0_g3~~TRINITY_DN61967_c0_g3_i2.p1  ORF type:complete len:306 (+),score=97.95 TRINITY_DN61967_c0_g3_i2:148-1065(+)
MSSDVTRPPAVESRSEPISVISGSIDSLSLASLNDPEREKWQRIMRLSLLFLFVSSSGAIPANMVMIKPGQRSDSRCRLWGFFALQYPAHCLLMFSRCRAIANFWTQRASRTIVMVLVCSVLIYGFGIGASKVDDNGVCFIHPVSTLATLSVLFLWIYLCFKFLQLLRSRRTVLVIMIAATGTSSAFLYVSAVVVIVGRISGDPGHLSIVVLTVDAALTSAMTLYMLYRIYVRRLLLRWLSRRGVKSRRGGREHKYRVGRQIQRDRPSKNPNKRESQTPRQLQEQKKVEGMVSVGLIVAHKIQPQ